MVNPLPSPRFRPAAVAREARSASADADRHLFPPFSPADLETCRAIGRLFDTARDVVLTTHIVPDGDGLGAEAALAAYLQRRGVRARILNADPPPSRLRFLETPAAPLGVYRGFEEDALAQADALVILDTGVTERLGPLASALPRLGGVRVCIDHHQPREPLGQLNLVDPRASSTAELVYRLLDALGAEMNPSLAVPLYVGVAFDTGWFRYSNTTREAHLVAADLCRYGVDAEELYARMFATHTAARMRLWGCALATLRVEAGGRLAWMVVDRALLRETGATREDLEGLAEQGRQVEGVEMSILFREDGPEQVKVSFRSRGAVDVNALAGRFGGGGHVNASGATLRIPLREAVARVLDASCAVLAPAEGHAAATAEPRAVPPHRGGA